MITTVEEFVAAVGGNKSAKEYFDVKSSAVSMWKDRGFIPGRQVVRAQKLATANGLAIDPKIFEEPPEDEVKARRIARRKARAAARKARKGMRKAA